MEQGVDEDPSSSSPPQSPTAEGDLTLIREEDEEVPNGMGTCTNQLA